MFHGNIGLWQPWSSAEPSSPPPWTIVTTKLKILNPSNFPCIHPRREELSDNAQFQARDPGVVAVSVLAYLLCLHTAFPNSRLHAVTGHHSLSLWNMESILFRFACQDYSHSGLPKYAILRSANRSERVIIIARAWTGMGELRMYASACPYVF